MAGQTLRIGIDLGGTKTELIALDGEGRECLRRRHPTPRGSYEGILEAIAAAVRDAESALGGSASVGVGIPGAISPATGLVKNANTTELIGHPLDRDLAAMLERPIRVANDANCFAVSEATDGAAAGAGVVFGVILGTGVGGGLVVAGHVVEGVNGIAGEWGHNPLPQPEDGERPGPPCYCGRNGCVETWLSGPGLSADHRRSEGEERSAPQIAAAAAAGDAACRRSLARYVDRLARALAGVINVVDPDVIVLGGGLGTIGALYEAVPRAWDARVFSDRVDTRLVPPQHGDSSGVRGAAWLWPR